MKVSPNIFDRGLDPVMRETTCLGMEQGPPSCFIDKCIFSVFHCFHLFVLELSLHEHPVKDTFSPVFMNDALACKGVPGGNFWSEGAVLVNRRLLNLL